MPAPSPAELLDLIIARAPALIAAGITHVSIEGLSATLVKPAPAPPMHVDKPKPPRGHIDPMRDPSTYPGGRVPGFTRDEDKEPGSGRRSFE